MLALRQGGKKFCQQQQKNGYRAMKQQALQARQRVMANCESGLQVRHLNFNYSIKFCYVYINV